MLLSGWGGFVVLHWPLIHVGRLRMHLLLHSHCLLLHAWLLLGLFHRCGGLGTSKLTRWTPHVTVTHWRMWSRCLPRLQTTHSKLLRALLLLLLLLLLLPSSVWPRIAKHHLPLRRTRLRRLRWQRVDIDQSARLV